MDPRIQLALNARKGYNLGAICIFLGGTKGSIGENIKQIISPNEWFNGDLDHGRREQKSP